MDTGGWYVWGAGKERMNDVENGVWMGSEG